MSYRPIGSIGMNVLLTKNWDILVEIVVHLQSLFVFKYKFSYLDSITKNVSCHKKSSPPTIGKMTTPTKLYEYL